MVGGKKNSNSSDSSSSANNNNNNNNKKNTKEGPPDKNSPIDNNNPPSSPSPFLNNPSNDDKDDRENNGPYHTPYAFNGRIVIGIGIILAIASAGTIYAMTVSQSPVIHVSWNGAGGNPGAPLLVGSAAGQQQQASSQKIDKSFVLVARDFGWNGSANGPTIRVNKGDTVRLTVINAGQMAHNFGMGKPSQETLRLLNETKNLPYAQRMQQIPYSVMQAMPCPGCQKEFEKGHIEFFILPDAQATTVFTADEAGQFKYFCMVRGHIWLGMHGDFIVDNGPISTVSATTAKGAGGMS